MRIAVITPCYNTPDTMWRICRESVRAQTISCTHIVVNDGGRDPAIVAGDGMQYIQLPISHRDYGDTPRAIGSISAIGQQFDALAWLDSDNWYEPGHLEELLQLHEATGASVCTSARALHHLNGERLGLCYEVDGFNFVDTNCYFLTRAAFPLIATWYLMDQRRHIIGDRVLWKAVRESGLTHRHSGLPTVSYRTRFRTHYLHFGVEPPDEAVENVTVQT